MGRGRRGPCLGAYCREPVERMVAESVCEGGVVEDEVVKGGRMNMKMWMLAALRSAALCGVCLGVAGCEEEGDTTVIEAPEIVVGTNAQVIVVNGNSGSVVVDQTTGGGDPSIFVTGNTGRVFVATRPEENVPEVE